MRREDETVPITAFSVRDDSSSEQHPLITNANENHRHLVLVEMGIRPFVSV